MIYSPPVTVNHEYVGKIGSAAETLDIRLFDDKFFLILVNIRRLRKDKRALLVAAEIGLNRGADHTQNGEGSCQIG